MRDVLAMLDLPDGATVDEALVRIDRMVSLTRQSLEALVVSAELQALLDAGVQLARELEKTVARVQRHQRDALT